jgi:ribosome-associated heat shock protein Hsp15
MLRKSGTRFFDQTALHEDSTNPDRQRIDRWLWHARIVRTRDAAAALAGAGYVRVNGARIDAPGRYVRAGDVITVALDRNVRVLKVRGFVERRGPASNGQSLYEDLTGNGP